MAYPYRVGLTEEQRTALRRLVGTGIAPARMRSRACILLNVDHGEGGAGGSGAAIAGALDIGPSTVLRVRRQTETARSHVRAGARRRGRGHVVA